MWIWWNPNPASDFLKAGHGVHCFAERMMAIWVHNKQLSPREWKACNCPRGAPFQGKGVRLTVNIRDLLASAPCGRLDGSSTHGFEASTAYNMWISFLALLKRNTHRPLAPALLLKVLCLSQPSLFQIAGETEKPLGYYLSVIKIYLSSSATSC